MNAEEELFVVDEMTRHFKTETEQTIDEDNVFENLKQQEYNEKVDKFINSIRLMLSANELTNEVDEMAIEMLRGNCLLYLEARDAIARDGLTFTSDRGNVSANPAIKIAKDAASQALSFMTEFGLTARSRKKLTSADEDKDDSPLKQFFGIDKKETR